MAKFSFKILLFLLLFSFSHSFFAESFRVHKLFSLTVPESNSENSSGESSEQTVSIGINDSIAVFLPEDRTFLEGIELNVKIPSAVADWRDSVAFSVYNNIRPVPDSSQIDYSGTRIFAVPLPAKLSWIVQVPLFERTSIKENNYVTKINVVPDSSNNYLFFRFQPAMKGVPDSTLEAKLTVLVKPIFKNIGRLNFDVKDSLGNEADYEVFVDEKPCSLENGNVILSSGSHNVTVVSENFRNEVRTVYVEQAKTVDVNVILKSLAPTLKVSAPDNAEVYLDDKKIQNVEEEFVISEGEHRVRFLIGGYEVIRSLSVEKGKSYNANLTVDLEITEE